MIQEAIIKIVNKEGLNRAAYSHMNYGGAIRKERGFHSVFSILCVHDDYLVESLRLSALKRMEALQILSAVPPIVFCRIPAQVQERYLIGT